jgi:hypothetical protein
MIKVSNWVEDIFAHAVALEQSGGMKNTIYALQDKIYILNYDHTVLMRFILRSSEKSFSQPIAFHANDYDSNQFTEEDGQIVFMSEKGDYQRKKSCGTPDLAPEVVEELFTKYSEDLPTGSLNLSVDVMGLLSKELSHVEFSGSKDGIKIIQRNIYSGGIIEIHKKKEGLFSDNINFDFGPVAVKTNDLFALFSFQDVLKFGFLQNGNFIVVSSVDKGRKNMQAYIACCLYDEIIQIREAKNGGQEQKIRRSK